jgi:hypothetical protein
MTENTDERAMANQNIGELAHALLEALEGQDPHEILKAQPQEIQDPANFPKIKMELRLLKNSRIRSVRSNSCLTSVKESGYL